MRLIGHEPPDGALLDVRLRAGSAVEVAKALQGARGTLRRDERIFPRYTAPGVEEGAFCRQADERVGVDRYGPKYILAAGLPPLGYLQGLRKTSVSHSNNSTRSISSRRL